MKNFLKLFTVLLALSGLGFSGNYLYASTACNGSGELFDCAMFPAGMSAAAQNAACDCACAEVYGTFGDCDVTGCCLCSV